MNDITNLILYELPIGVVVFDSKGMVFRNRQAERFYKRFSQPEEIDMLCKRIYDSIRSSTFDAVFPGEIYVYKKIDQSPSNWIFKFEVFRKADPCICVFIIEESVANKVNVNKIRLKYRLTRRETDVLRRVFGGLKNSDIAEELSVSEQTVKDHLSNIYFKTGTKHRFELVNFLLNTAADSGTDLYS
jgi:DNA-binding CsgD family transcriptional regulator